ncbi:tRNA (uridine(54)-C5)-methyltransferase TrmA [uncultured Ruminobacter sp.]|uniref:tRNA (uridine(54)-C5)-methyltransferase TrmA n=1 Tax=uncultured Ruminobacter sp. TaxID=538947 RepID=UPI0025DD3CF9|nr:tRNA (uridine(54)-C5)-methyltransferase TrmA [uncultured Ruminobacter sp.]
MKDFEILDTSTYEQQLTVKTSRLTAEFKNLFNVPAPEIFTSDPIHYRMRAKFCIYLEGDTVRYYMVDTSDQNKRKAFLKQFPTASVLINRLMPVIAELISGNAELTRKFFEINFLTTLSGEALITLLYHRKLDEVWIEAARNLLKQLRERFPDNVINIIGRALKQKILLDTDCVYETLTVNGRKYRYQQVENSFTQPNAHVSEKMLTWVQDNTRGLSDTDLLELYCGNGNFSIALSGNFRKILATEISKTSVESAQINIAMNNVTNLKIIRLSAEEFTEALNKKREFNRLKNNNVNLDDYSCRAVLVDPPRAGLDPDTIDLLKRYEIIIYISCNPVTLMDNLKSLTETHDISRFAFFDQFPYTEEHIESGVILTRKPQ